MAVQVDKTQAKQPFQVTRAKCGQCGKELRYVPFSLNNIMCRDCYGLDRYRRNAPSVITAGKPAAPVGTAASGAASVVSPGDASAIDGPDSVSDADGMAESSSDEETGAGAS